MVVTRAARQAGELSEALRRRGARVEALPLIEVVPPPDPAPLARAAQDCAAYQAIALTSANAARAFFEGWTQWTPRNDPGALPPIAAVGPATAAEVEAQGGSVALVAQRSRGAGLAAALIPHLEPGARVLLPQAADARPELAAALHEAGLQPVPVIAYDKRLPAGAAGAAEALFAHRPLGWVTFTSPRIVRHFVDLLEPGWEGRREELRAASIGPVTSDALRRVGVEPAAEAPRPDAESLCQAITEAVAASPRPGPPSGSSE